MPKSNKNLTKITSLFDGAATLSIITAYVYIWSTAYYNGYLSALQLDLSVVEKSFNQIMYIGWLLLFMPLNIVILGITIFILLIYKYKIKADLHILNIPLMLIILSGGFIYFDNAGHDDGFFIYEQKVLKNSVDLKRIKVDIKDQKKELILIICGENMCAGMDQTSKEIFYFKKEDGFSFTRNAKQYVMLPAI